MLSLMHYNFRISAKVFVFRPALQFFATCHHVYKFPSCDEPPFGLFFKLCHFHSFRDEPSVLQQRTGQGRECGSRRLEGQSPDQNLISASRDPVRIPPHPSSSVNQNIPRTFWKLHTFWGVSTEILDFFALVILMPRSLFISSLSCRIPDLRPLIVRICTSDGFNVESQLSSLLRTQSIIILFDLLVDIWFLSRNISPLAELGVLYGTATWLRE
jgi:hypothetical protein